MKSIQILFVLLLSTAVFVGCGKKAKNSDGSSSSDTSKEISNTTASKFDDMAKEACNCTEGIAPMMKKVNELAEAGNTAALSELTKELQPKIEVAQKCITEVENKYADLQKEVDSEKKIEESLQKLCPIWQELEF